MSPEDTVQLESMNMQKYLLSKKVILSEMVYEGMKINQTANKKYCQNKSMDKWHKKVLAAFQRLWNKTTQKIRGAGYETQT